MKNNNKNKNKNNIKSKQLNSSNSNNNNNNNNNQDSNSFKQQLLAQQQQFNNIEQQNNNNNDNQQSLNNNNNNEVVKPKSRRGSLLKDPEEYNKVVSELIKTLQQREIFTLKEIYKNEFSILKHTDKCYRLCLSFILPNERIGLSSFRTSLLEDENFEDYCTVSKLPPIYLTFKYNDSYPLLSSVEYFKLDCEWLTENCLTTLSNQLITLWTSNINLPIISIWANWLKNESLFFLNLYSIRTTKTVIPKLNDNNESSSLLLSTSSSSSIIDTSTHINNSSNEQNVEQIDNDNGFKNYYNDDDKDQVELEESNQDNDDDDDYYEESILNTHYSLTLPPIYINHVFGQDPISYLVDWDLDNGHLSNNNNQKTCVICKSNNFDLNFVDLYNCNHDFCEECLSAYISLNIEEDTLNKIVCPEQDCQVLLNLSPFEIRDLVSSYTFDLYLERLTNNNNNNNNINNNNNNCCDHHHYYDCDQVLKLLKDESINQDNFYDAINQNCDILSHNHNNHHHENNY